MENESALDEEQLAGRCLMVGLPGETLGEKDSRILADLRPGGLILFNRNLRERSKACEFVNAAQTAAAPRLVAVDQEGGRVDRLRDVFPAFPSAEALAGPRAGEAEIFRAFGALTGKVLRAFGCNVNFAPVLDLHCNDTDNALRGRYLGSDPSRIAINSAQYIAGLRQEQVAGCGKHFPGLGRAVLDSHTGLPVIDVPAERLMNEDMLPYRYLCAQLPMVMVAHAAYPTLADEFGEKEDAMVPASCLPPIYRLLKAQRFKGISITDDLDMGAVRKAIPADEIATRVFQAGADLLLVGADLDFARLCRDQLALLFRAPFWKEAAQWRIAKQDILPPLSPANPKNVAQVEKEFSKWKAGLKLAAEQEP